jgi:hypothetical protein
MPAGCRVWFLFVACGVLLLHPYHGMAVSWRVHDTTVQCTDLLSANSFLLFHAKSWDGLLVALSYLFARCSGGLTTDARGDAHILHSCGSHFRSEFLFGSG